jgi:GcrA cell cycle regulator
MSFVWSPEAIDQLHRLYVQEGRSAGEAARALGRGVTRNAVLGKIQRLGWVGRRAAPKPPKPKPPKPRPPTPRPAGPRHPSHAPAKPAPRPRPLKGAIPLPVLREIAAPCAPRLWTDREEGQCAFPVGEPALPGLQLSCCAPTVGRRPYCPAHRALMVLPGSALTREEEDAIVEIARRTA